MERTLPVLRLDWRPLRWALYAALVVAVPLNLYLIGTQVAYMLSPAAGLDYRVLAEAARDATPYQAPPHGYVWSPLAIPLLAVLTAPGYVFWGALHVAALGFLRDWRLIGLVLLSFPFWFDVGVGNVMVFVAVAAYLAVSGSRAGTAAFFLLALLIPRPLMLPALAWILWQRPDTRLPFAILFVAHAIGVLATGLGDDWIANTMQLQMHVGADYAIGPAVLFGWWWTPIGLALAAWLTYRGRLGLASVAVMPYLFAQYLTMLLLELRPRVATDSPR